MNKVFPDSESELELSKATVPGGSVALLWLKVFCNNNVEFENICSIIVDRLSEYSEVFLEFRKGVNICKRKYM